jgi:hypothetical protein
MYGNAIVINKHYTSDLKRVLPYGQTRLLKEIAKEIQTEISEKSYYIYAQDYIEALLQLEQIDDQYYADSAVSIVNYLLANLQSWKGDKARAIKAELKTILDNFQKGKK